MEFIFVFCPPPQKCTLLKKTKVFKGLIRWYVTLALKHQYHLGFEVCSSLQIRDSHSDTSCRAAYKISRMFICLLPELEMNSLTLLPRAVGPKWLVSTKQIMKVEFPFKTCQRDQSFVDAIKNGDVTLLCQRADCWGTSTTCKVRVTWLFNRSASSVAWAVKRWRISGEHNSLFLYSFTCLIWIK